MFKKIFIVLLIFQNIKSLDYLITLIKKSPTKQEIQAIQHQFDEEIQNCSIFTERAEKDHQLDTIKSLLQAGAQVNFESLWIVIHRNDQEFFGLLIK